MAIYKIREAGGLPNRIASKLGDRSVAIGWLRRFGLACMS